MEDGPPEVPPRWRDIPRMKPAQPLSAESLPTLRDRVISKFKQGGGQVVHLWDDIIHPPDDY